MTFEVQIEHNADLLARKLNLAQRKQIPFAVQEGLNSLAFEARDTIRRELPFRFTIRSSRIKTGVAVSKANKRDWPDRIRSAVGIRDEFMVAHETGGLRRPSRESPGKGLPRIAIPTRVVEARRTSTGRIPKSLRPREIIAANRARVQSTKTGRGIIRLSNRVAKRQRKRKTAILFLLRRSVRIRPRWDFRITALEVAGAKYPGIFREKLEFALRTAR